MVPMLNTASGGPQSGRKRTSSTSKHELSSFKIATLIQPCAELAPQWGLHNEHTIPILEQMPIICATQYSEFVFSAKQPN
jgi:hypothetical protein